MKKITRFFAVMMLCIPALMVTSCLSDNDEDFSFTNEEIAGYMRQMDGYYSGKVYFYNDTIKQEWKGDSAFVSVRFNFADSSMVMSDVPIRLFTRCLMGTRFESVSAELDKLPVQTIKAKTVFYNSTKNGLVYYGIYPASTTFKIKNGETEHNLVYNYYCYLNSNGQYYNHEVACQMYITDVMYDNNTVVKYTLTNSYVDNAAMIAFRGSSSFL